MTSAKRALVVEGGAMRGVFAAGVLDAFMEQDYNPFDFAIGVSAGSTNLIGYLAKEHKRSLRILTEHAQSSNFLNPLRYLTGGHFCDVEWLWRQSFEDLELDLEHYMARQVPLYVVTTRVDTGQACYIEVTRDNMHDLFPASCAIPFIYRDYPEVNGIPMTDGGVADSIPVEKAYEMGAREITVILSQSLRVRKQVYTLPGPVEDFLLNHLVLRQAITDRPDKFNRSLEFITNPPDDCKIHVIAPPADFRVGRFTRNLDALHGGYEIGRKRGFAFLEEAQQFA
ncbi:phospholipase [Pseudidiomarina salinarum]|uniref:Phospholipase n=1 Tax=Pseudidiomarina salinarum TaxID=435908 RepID=A0A094L871_9GAMM|nr:patatin family protein [Pseudidiomarina salinarum]KFZ30998.1 phospholipase [Pseudidiomarina salinarum]RUO71482.1 patatin family protein [Pseudidiomarina salinarum]